MADRDFECLVIAKSKLGDAYDDLVLALFDSTPEMKAFWQGRAIGSLTAAARELGYTLTKKEDSQ